MMADDGDMLAAIIQANLTYYNDAYRNVTDRMHGGELADDLDNIEELVARFSKVGEPILKDFITSIVRGKSPCDYWTWDAAPATSKFTGSYREACFWVLSPALKFFTIR